MHDISNNVVCTTSKASDQPAHTRSLIRAFASHFSILWLLSYWLNIIWSWGCRGSSKSTYFKLPHCWNSYATAHVLLANQYTKDIDQHMQMHRLICIFGVPAWHIPILPQDCAKTGQSITQQTYSRQAFHQGTIVSSFICKTQPY